MKRTPRVLAAVVAATALTFTGVHTAEAKPDRAGTHAKAEKSAKVTSGKNTPETRFAREVERVQARLAKAVSDKRIEDLDEADRTAVLASAGLDTAALASVTSREKLRSFRVENYRLVVNVLRKAAQLRAAATAAGSDLVTTLSAETFAAVAGITAQTPRADAKPVLKAARLALAEAAAVLDPDTDTDGGTADPAVVS